MGVKFVGLEPCDGFGNQIPLCPHGPMLLFQRAEDGSAKASRQFYACAACRDRKQCPYFLWRDEKISEGKVRQWHERVAAETKRTACDHNARYTSARAVLAVEGARYCLDCSQLVGQQHLPSHRSHQTRPVADQHTRPSQLLRPLSANKLEAQYLFSDDTATSLVALLKEAGVRRVVCCGAPRLHERLLENGTDSLMLDMDRRYEEFWPPERLVIFNMFNNHVFSERGRDVLRDFVKRDDGQGLALVVDPPFGGRLEALALTLSAILSDVTAPESTPASPVFLVLPYFNEPDVLRWLPSLHMTDLRIEYDNHASFTAGAGGRKHGSPVRLFTSVPGEQLRLPEPEYRLCAPCRRWVHRSNVHCQQCAACTSKDGRPYRHCDLCTRCVKVTWRHCQQCDRCALPDHPCSAADGGAPLELRAAVQDHFLASQL